MEANNSQLQIPQQPVQQVNNIQTPPFPKPKKRFLFIGIVIAALLIVAGSSFAAYHYVKKSPKQESNKITNTPTITPVPTLNPTASWKTYTNTQYGFEFKYPNSWITTESSTSSHYFVSASPDSNYLNAVSVYVYNNPKTLSTKQYIQENYRQNPPLNFTGIILDGTNGERTQDIQGQSGTDTVIITKGSEAFVINVIKQSSGSVTSKSTFDQILSTFKFLQNPNTTNDFSSDYFIWNVSNSKLPDATLQQIKSDFMNFTPSKADDLTHTDRKIEITGFDISSLSANMVFASLMLVDKNKQSVPTEGFEYMLVNKNNSWKIISADNNEFCPNLKNAPEDLLSGFRKMYYGQCF